MSVPFDDIVRTTEYIACPAAYRYKKTLPVKEWAVEHYWNVLGRACHTVFESILKGEPVNYQDATRGAFDRYGEHSWRLEERVKTQLPIYEAMFRQWLSETKLDLNNLTIEHEICMNFHGVRQIGHPDAFNDDVLLDFKTGHQFQSKWTQQVADYCYALATEDGLERKVYIILVNNEEWKERLIPEADLSEAFNKNHDRMRWWRFEVAKEYPDTEVTPLCAACHARHVCPGI